MVMPLNEKIENCIVVGDVIGVISNKWTIFVIISLYNHSLRFNAIKRQVMGISHQMLARTLKDLTHNGLVERTVVDNNPPMVEYHLSALGYSLADALKPLADWAKINQGKILINRDRAEK
ncbi:winged helix-turn-helix transcriptional regulator [Pantoea stewartii]|uniref:winged helix-turn-helix transcriptional regulator n=1 Tax=Pantoea stewartii TaxID=66269 RepID=UPI0016238A13|nr:helix-turn-helix domain-containing protein [Pantoea stewartii]MBC0856439.1 helix-turn-helix transcriptional regulator [Pantoea stewartii]